MTNSLQGSIPTVVNVPDDQIRVIETGGHKQGSIGVPFDCTDRVMIATGIVKNVKSITVCLGN